MRNIMFALFIALMMNMGCFQAADRVEITEIRDADLEHRDSLPTLGTPARMGLADPAETRPSPPHDAMPPPMLQAPPAAAASEAPALAPEQLRWQAPEEWRRDEERPMRLATYLPANTEGTECAVTLLFGAAGGVAANLNRWRVQFGREPLSDDELAALPRWNMLDAQAVYLACADNEGANMLYGVICPVPGGLLFVKMTGPLNEMEPEEERFKEFCLSMSVNNGQ